MTPIRPSVSPLHSFAARPDMVPTCVRKTSWTKRAAQWLASLRNAGAGRKKA